MLSALRSSVQRGLVVKPVLYYICTRPPSPPPPGGGGDGDDGGGGDSVCERVSE